MNEQEQRLAMYRKIEVARKQLPDMDETAFRELLQNEFGKTSRKDMRLNELSRLLAIFADLGVQFKSKKPGNRHVWGNRKDFMEITDSMPYAPEKRQILAIWHKLGYAISSLDTRVQRAFNCQCFAWLKNREQISTLLSDLQRREKAFDKKHAQCPTA